MDGVVARLSGVLVLAREDLRLGFIKGAQTLASRREPQSIFYGGGVAKPAGSEFDSFEFPVGSYPQSGQGWIWLGWVQEFVSELLPFARIEGHHLSAFDANGKAASGLLNDCGQRDNSLGSTGCILRRQP